MNDNSKKPDDPAFTYKTLYERTGAPRPSIKPLSPKDVLAILDGDLGHTSVAAKLPPTYGSTAGGRASADLAALRDLVVRTMSRKADDESEDDEVMQELLKYANQAIKQQVTKVPEADQMVKDLENLLHHWSHQARANVHKALRGRNDHVVEVYNRADAKNGVYPWVAMPMSAMIPGCIFRFTAAAREAVFFLVEPIQQSKDMQGITTFVLKQVPISTKPTKDGDVLPGELPDIKTNTITTSGLSGERGQSVVMNTPAAEDPSTKEYPDSIEESSTDPMDFKVRTWFHGTHKAMVPFLRDIFESYQEGVREGFDVESIEDRAKLISEAIGGTVMPDVFVVTNGDMFRTPQGQINVILKFDSQDVSRHRFKHELVVERNQVTLTSRLDQPGQSAQYLGTNSEMYQGNPAVVIPQWMLEDDENDDTLNTEQAKKLVRSNLVRKAKSPLHTMLNALDGSLPNGAIENYLTRLYQEFVRLLAQHIPAGDRRSALYDVSAPSVLSILQLDWALGDSPQSTSLVLQFEVLNSQGKRMHVRAVFPSNPARAVGAKPATLVAVPVPSAGEPLSSVKETEVHIPLKAFLDPDAFEAEDSVDDEDYEDSAAEREVLADAAAARERLVRKPSSTQEEDTDEDEEDEEEDVEDEDDEDSDD